LPTIAFFNSEILSAIMVPRSVKAIMMTRAINAAAKAYSEISIPLSSLERFLFLLALIFLSFPFVKHNVGERSNRDRSEIILIRVFMSTTLINYRIDNPCPRG